MNQNASGTVVKAALTTAIAVLVALTAIEHLDEPLKRAAYDFGWSIPLLAGYLVLDYVASHLARAGKNRGQLVRFTHMPCFVVGSIFWLQGATAILQHFPIPPTQIVILKAVFVIVLTIAAAATAGSSNKSKSD